MLATGWVTTPDFSATHILATHTQTRVTTLLTQKLIKNIHKYTKPPTVPTHTK